MASPSEQLAAYIHQLSEQTSAGKMIWKQANPTTLVWEAESPPYARITLQKVARPTRVMGGRVVTATNYILQALDKTGLARLSLSSVEFPDLKETLAELYSHARVSLNRDGLEFLKKILPG